MWAGARYRSPFKYCFHATFGNWCRFLRFYKTMSTNLSFYLSLPDKPVYLKHRNCSETDRIATERKPVLASRYATLFIIDSLSNHGSGGSDNYSREKSYVRSCLSTQKLFRELVEEEELSSSFEFVLGAKTSQCGTTMGRQLFALLADDAPKTACNAMCSYAQKHDFAVWVYERDTEKTSCIWRLGDYQRSKVAIDAPSSMPDMLEESDNYRPMVSPIFQDSTFSPVYHDYKRAVKILNMYRECPEVQQLLEIAAQELANCKSLSELESMMKHPIVVVEGMDATGKTTLTEFLEEKLEAARYSTPPPCLLPLRRFFDKLPEIVRRAYYSLGNYIVAQNIAAECQKRAVVMDRYWHSTTAYGIANETSFEDLLPQEHSDYIWPADLLKPTAVIFLTVTEQVRRERLGNRHENNITFEERSLNKDQLLRKRLCEAYLRMREPACIPVDASGSKEEVLEAVLKQLEVHGITMQ